MTTRQKRILYLGIVAALGAIYLARGQFERILTDKLKSSWTQEVRRAEQKAREEEKQLLRVLEAEIEKTFSSKEIVLNPKEVGGRGDLRIRTVDYNPGLLENPGAAKSIITLHPSEKDFREKDDSTRINRAIQSASPSTKIILSKGLYHIKHPIRLKSGVVLAGEGMRETVIISKNIGGAIRIEGTVSDTKVDIIAGYELA